MARQYHLWYCAWGNIIVSWFYENMTGHEVITVSLSGYTNEGICIVWLDYFIKYNNCRPNKPWHILLIDSATCHKADDFILKAKINKIWVVKFPMHQTYLLQPCELFPAVEEILASQYYKYDLLVQGRVQRPILLPGSPRAS
jgi:hypothetical protein